jgi:hypothetical protein
MLWQIFAPNGSIKKTPPPFYNRKDKTNLPDLPMENGLRRLDYEMKTERFRCLPVRLCSFTSGASNRSDRNIPPSGHDHGKIRATPRTEKLQKSVFPEHSRSYKSTKSVTSG